MNESPAVEHQSHTNTFLHDLQYQLDPRHLPGSQYHPDPRHTTQGRPLQPHYSITPTLTPTPPGSPTHRHTAGPGVGHNASFFLYRRFFLLLSPFRYLLHFSSLLDPKGQMEKFLTSAIMSITSYLCNSHDLFG